MNDYIQFVGHSTVFINIDGNKILTDPNLARFVFGVPRFEMAKADINDLNRSDIILISHPHKDHLNKATLRNISKNIPVMSHNDNIEYIKDLNFEKIIGFDYWQERPFFNEKVKITLVPAKHARTLPLNPMGSAAGFIIETEKISVYFAGDTAFDKDIFFDIGKKFDIDVALIPIGAYYPRWILKNIHIDPEEALRALEIIGAKKMIPIHWGSFMMSLDTPYDSAYVLRNCIKGTRFEKKVVILKNGEKHYF